MIRTVSLRQRLAWWMLPALILTVLAAAGWSYGNAINIADQAYDRALTTALRGIAENIHFSDGQILIDIPYATLEMNDEGVQERVYYKVIGPDGTVLTGYPDLAPPSDAPAASTQPQFATARHGDHKVRMAMLSKRLYAPELTGGDAVTVLFAETTEARTQLAMRLFLDGLMWQALLIAVVIVLLTIALARTFRPLLALRDAIRSRKAEDLTPVPVGDVPSEVRPLIDAINGHMARLAHMLQARRRFLADAAHQIRTPLAVLGTQAEYGQRQHDAEEMRRTFASMQTSIRGTRHMANQMLILARAEPANGLIQEHAVLDLAALAREVAGDFALLALSKEIALAYEAPPTPIDLSGHAIMLREMIANLVDNALRYTPAGGHVTVAVEQKAAQIRLSVIDDGPGIPESEREKVFQRFYRVLGSGDSEGSGLGLCIVQEICKAHGGHIRLDTAADGHGLRAEITLPAHDFLRGIAARPPRTSD